MNTLPVVLDELDLTEPVDFLLAIYHAESWPLIASFSEERYNRDLPIVEKYHSAVFGVVWDELASGATWGLISELGGKRVVSGRELSAARREWLSVFRTAFEARLIGPVQWGAALACLLTTTEGNGVPGVPAHSLEAKEQMLADVRAADPAGLMSPSERAAWEDLPSTVELYRGGYTLERDYASHLRLARSGLHWALEPQYSLLYMRGRGSQYTVQSIRSAVQSLQLRFAGRKQEPVTDLCEHRHYLICARVPRECVLAYHVRALALGGGALRGKVELMVDFERITPDMMQDITPESYQWAA